MTLTPKELTILVSGATGQQGGAVAHHLLKRGFRVRALTRYPEQEAAQKLADQGVEITEGSFNDRASLDRALEGVHGAFSVQNIVEGIETEIQQGKTFANAARDAGIQHFVYSSVGGADRETGIPHFESKWAIEEHIQGLGIPSTILRPVFFMNNWEAQFKDAILGGQIPLPLSPDTSLEEIAVDDIGVFAALAFANPDKWKGRAIDLAGDELTMTGTAEVLSRVLDREVEYIQVPWEAYQEQLSEFLGEELGEELTMMYRWFEDEGYDTDIVALRNEHPGLKRLEPFLRNRDWTQKATNNINSENKS